LLGSQNIAPLIATIYNSTIIIQNISIAGTITLMGQSAFWASFIIGYQQSCNTIISNVHIASTTDNYTYYSTGIYTMFGWAIGLSSQTAATAYTVQLTNITY
jgi:hypothetical protein